MALLTILRSPTPSASDSSVSELDDCFGLCDESALEEQIEEDDVLADDTVVSTSRHSCSFRQRSSSECYFAVKGAAVILPQTECIMTAKCNHSAGGEIQQHLQAMLHLLRPQDTLKMAVRLESQVGGEQHTRYLAIVSTSPLCSGGKAESAVLGIDYGSGVPSSSSSATTIGLVLPIYANTAVLLDGDGGISVESRESHHLFKPVSVQAMWSAFQQLHKEHAVAREQAYFAGGATHTWVESYRTNITSPEKFRSEWHYTYRGEDDGNLRADGIERYKEKPVERATAEKMIRITLKDIMQSVDLDEVTSKDIRHKLEEREKVDLSEYKEFIDQEMLVILGQMDKPSQIFPYLYLGTEWNASNYEELKQNNVGYILNVTKEVDNFFPGLFNYTKIRVSDEQSTELLRHWDTTNRFIAKAKESNCSVLVHCKKGISRSSSTVIAWAMKEYNMSLDAALNYVKEKRNCITPNKGFMTQLATYDGILEASKYRNSKLFNQIVQSVLKPSVDAAEEEFRRRSQMMICPAPPIADAAADMGGNADGDIDDKSVITMEKSTRPVILPELLVASENILKSCPRDEPAQSGSGPDQANVTRIEVQPDDNTPSTSSNLPLADEDNLPPVSSRPPVKKQLQNVEQRIRDSQNELTLKDVQQILMRTKRHSSDTNGGAPSSSGASSMESDASSLGGSSSDGDDAELQRLQIRQARRNSKSSSSGSAGDSAVAELNTTIVSGQVQRVKQTYEQWSSQQVTGQEVPPPVKKGSGRKFLEKLFTNHHHKLPAVKSTTRWYHRSRPKSESLPSNLVIEESSPCGIQHHRPSIKAMEKGKVKSQKEALERINAANKSVTVKRIRSNIEGIGHSARPVGLRRITTNDCRFTTNDRHFTTNDRHSVGSDDNMVRSLVGVFESGSLKSGVGGDVSLEKEDVQIQADLDGNSARRASDSQLILDDSQLAHGFRRTMSAGSCSELSLI